MLRKDRAPDHRPWDVIRAPSAFWSANWPRPAHVGVWRTVPTCRPWSEWRWRFWRSNRLTL